MKPRLAIPLALCASLGLWVAILKGCEALAQMPPKQFQHGANVEVTFMDQDKANWLCNTKREAGTLQACVIKANQVTHREAKQKFGLSGTQYYRIRNGESW